MVSFIPGFKLKLAVILLILQWRKMSAIKSKYTPVSAIGEYSAKKIYFFPGWRKNCEKVSPYFSLSEEENCQKLHFFEKKIVKISIFLGKIVKICNFLGGKHCKNLEK